MQKIILRRISFGSYIKITALIAFGMGLAFGLLFLIIALLGGTVTMNGEVVDYGAGVRLGLFAVFIFPLAWSFVMGIFSILTFPVARLFLKLIRGIKIKVIIDEIQTDENTEENDDAGNY